MKLQTTRWMLLAGAVVVGLLMHPLHAETFEKTMTAGGVPVHYKVVLPNDYDPAKA
jgi:hypothetical protein